VSISTGRWSDLSAEHVARCTGEWKSLLITMSKTSGVTVGLSFRRRNHAGLCPSSWSTGSFSRHVWRSGHQPVRPAALRQNKRPSPLRSVGGQEEGMPQGLSPVCRTAKCVWLLPPHGSSPERALLCHGGPVGCAAPSCPYVCVVT
jgi:hypothetical protein